MGEDLERANSQSTVQEKWDSAEAYDGIYSKKPSETWSRIWRDVYGDDYPEEAEPMSWVTKTDLVCIVHFLSIGSGKTFVDLGCGRGGPGLWVARETGADLIGIDLSPAAIEHAKQRISVFGLEGHAQFSVADLYSTGLPDGSCQGAMSIDVLWMVPDEDAALDEVARILCCGSRFVLTTWESTKAGGTDYRLRLQDCGFSLEEYYEKPDWRRRQNAVYERILAEQAALIEEMGEAAARPFINEAKEVPGRLPCLRHVLIACRRV